MNRSGSGVFRKEADKAFVSLLSNKHFLTKLSYEEVYKLWSSASEALYNKNFGNISEKLHSIISDSYFPKNANYYYEKFHCEIEITAFDEGYITSRETIKINIKAENTDKLMINSGTYIIIDEREPEKSKIDIKNFVIYPKEDDQEILFKLRNEDIVIEEKNGKKQFNKAIPISGHEDYTLHRVIEKTYPLKVNETKTFTFSTITAYASICIVMNESEQKKLSGRYERLGTLNSFTVNETQKELIKNCVLYKDYTGLILPKQGFMFHFNVK